jgi:hypothetical protein
LSLNGIWYPRRNGPIVFRPSHDFIQIHPLAIGKFFPLRDVVIASLALFKTEDPRDGVALLDFYTSYIPIGLLKKDGLREYKMPTDKALLHEKMHEYYMQNLCNMNLKEFHVWLRTHHETEIT